MLLLLLGCPWGEVQQHSRGSSDRTSGCGATQWGRPWGPPTGGGGALGASQCRRCRSSSYCRESVGAGPYGPPASGWASHRPHSIPTLRRPCLVLCTSPPPSILPARRNPSPLPFSLLALLDCVPSLCHPLSACPHLKVRPPAFTCPASQPSASFCIIDGPLALGWRRSAPACRRCTRTAALLNRTRARSPFQKKTCLSFRCYLSHTIRLHRLGSPPSHSFGAAPFPHAYPALLPLLSYSPPHAH